MKSPLVSVFIVLAQFLMWSPAGASPPKPIPPRTLTDDMQRRIDVNRLNLLRW